jgi:hypothetical protein
MTPLPSSQFNANFDSGHCDTIHINDNCVNADYRYDNKDMCINIVNTHIESHIVDCVSPSPLDNHYNADVIVDLIDDSVGTRDAISSYDNDSMYMYNGNNLQFCDLNHLINCYISNCKFCLFIGQSFISFMHYNIGFIPLGPFISGNNFSHLNSGEGGGSINS